MQAISSAEMCGRDIPDVGGVTVGYTGRGLVYYGIGGRRNV